MTHVKALQAGHYSQGTSEPITPRVVHCIVEGFVLEIIFVKLLNVFDLFR